MLLLTPSIAFAVCAFIFGGVVEGEVFKQEILEGLRDMTLLNKRGYHYLIVNAFGHYLKLTPSQSGFLAEYQRLLSYIEILHGKKLTDRQRAEKKSAQKRLRHMREYFSRLVMSDSGVIPDLYVEDDELRLAVLAIREQLPVMKGKMAMLRIAVPFSLLCGAGFGFATASALPVALAAISASLSFLVWPLAIIAAIGYTFLIFHTAKDILFSDGFRKWKDRIKKWFTPEVDGVTAMFVLKAVAISLITTATIALCVMGTLATAGTWWLAVKHGAKLIPYVKTVANIIRNVLAPVAAFGNFIFSLYNSFESIHVIKRALEFAQPIQQLRRQWQALRVVENWVQIFNPFRIICKFIQKTTDAVLLLGHVLASGTARDRFMSVSPTILAVTTAGSELTQDITFFFKEGKKTMTQWAVSFLLSPLLLLSAAWQCLASRCNPPQQRVSLLHACKQAFGVVEKSLYSGDDAPPQSMSWRQVEIHRYFEKNVSRLERAVIGRDAAQSEIRELAVVKNTMLMKNETDTGSASVEYQRALARYRLFDTGHSIQQVSSSDEMIDHRHLNAI